MTELKQHLINIRNKVAATHWTRKTYHYIDNNNKDLYCLVGHINLESGRWMQESSLMLHSAIQDTEETKIIKSHLVQIIREEIKALYPKTADPLLDGAIENWNDHPNRRREHVLKVLDSAINKC